MSYSTVTKRLRDAYNAQKTKPYEYRIEQMQAFLRMIEENTGAMVESLAKDLRKSKMETLMFEINVVIGEIKYLLENLRAFMEPERAKKDLPYLFDELLIVNEPYGLVLILGAWNYPIQLTLVPFVGALSAGNAVILKPSELAPATAKLLAELIPKYLDNDCYHVVTGGVTETTELLKERFDYVFFTGSTSVGRIVRDAANKYLTPCTLELGGKSPVYLDGTVDMEIAARRVLWGKCINAGQTCIAPDYLMCTKETERKFVDVAKNVLKEFYGDRPESSPDFARIVNANHFKRLERLLNGVETVAVGGKTDADDNYVSPTIVVDVKATDPLMADEIFGPILPILTVEGHHEAIDYINGREKPLALYVFSNDRSVVEDFVGRTSSGGVAVNDTIVHAGPKSLPFGGVGASGMGAYHGKASFDTFVHKKSTLIKNLGKFGEKLSKRRYPPYSEANIKYITKMLGKKLPKIPFKLDCVLTFSLGLIVAFTYNYFVRMSNEQH